MSNSNTLQMRLEFDDRDAGKIRAIGAEVKKVGDEGDRGFAKMRASLNDFDKSGKVSLGTIAAMGAGLAVLGAAAAAAFGAMMVGAIKAASDLSETTNKFNTVFAGMTDQANVWAGELQTSYAMSKNGSMDMLASLQVLNQGMGMTQGEAGKLSSDMIKLAVDLGSFNNLPTVDVLEAMRSAIVGEYDPIQRFAGAINAATVEQKALSLGLVKTGEDITGAAKAQAMYQLVIESNTFAIGDFIKTADGLANQTKRFETNIDDLKAAFGARLMPVAADVLKQINEGMQDSEGGVVGLSEAISVGLLKAMLKAIETMRFFHNGWLGIKLVGTAAIEEIALALSELSGLFMAVLPNWIKALDGIAAGMVKLGFIDANPFEKLDIGLGTFALSSRDVTNQVLADIDKTNAGYNKIAATIQGYITQVKSTGAAHAAAGAVAGREGKGAKAAVDQMTAAQQRAAEQQKQALDDIHEKYIETTQSNYEAKKWGLEQETAEMIKNANGNKQALDEIAEYKRISMLKMLSYDERYTKAQQASMENYRDGWAITETERVEADRNASAVLEAQTEHTTNVMTEGFSRAADDIQSYMADIFQGAEFSFDSILDIFKRMLAEMLAAIIMSGIKNALMSMWDTGSMSGAGSAFMSGVSSAFGGGSDGGGTSYSGSENIAGVAGKAVVGKYAAGQAAKTLGSNVMGYGGMALGAYGMYSGAKDWQNGNKGVGGAKMGLGAVSAYKGAVTVGLIEKGAATEAAKWMAAKMGAKIAAEKTVEIVAAKAAEAAAYKTTAYVAGKGATSYATFQAGASGASGSGGSAAAGMGAGGAGVVAGVVAVAALVAYKAWEKSKKPSASTRIDKAGITGQDLGGFTQGMQDIQGSILATVPMFAKYKTAMYDQSTQLLTLANDTSSLRLQYDAASAAGHQWSSTITGGTVMMASASGQIMASFAGITPTAEETSRAINLTNNALAGLRSGAGDSEARIGQLETYLLDLGFSAIQAAAAADQLMHAQGNMAQSSLAAAGMMEGAAGRVHAAQANIDVWSNNYSPANASHIAPASESANRNNPSLKYHATGGIFSGPTQWGNHIISERQSEALIPLPDGPDTLSKIIDRLDRIESKQSSGPQTIVLHNYIGNEKLDSRTMIIADHVAADRQAQGTVGKGRI